MTKRTLYAEIRVKLPTFALVVLRKRARDRRKTVSSLLETLLLEDLMVDEVGAMIVDSPDFARMFSEWFRYAITRRK